MRARRAFPAILLLLAACTPAGTPLAPSHAEAHASAAALVSARLGQTVQVGGLRIRPLSIQEDSRCPADAACIQGGTLRLAAWLQSGSESEHRVLALDQPFRFAGRHIELVAGCPYPLASQPVAPADRRFVFAVGSSPRERPENPPDFCA
jgi:hypothetical protein